MAQAKRAYSKSGIKCGHPRQGHSIFSIFCRDCQDDPYANPPRLMEKAEWQDHRSAWNHYFWECEVDNCPTCDRIVASRPWLLEEYEESLRASDKA